MKTILLTVLLFAILFSQATAQDATLFPKGEISTDDHHTGTVWLNELNKPDNIFNYSIAQASFAPGAKLNWHIHPAGQVLLITEGVGYYQEKGKPVQTVRKGDVVKCLPGLEHWHGASLEGTFAYIASTPAHKGKTIWLQPVTNEQYTSVKPTIETFTNAEQELVTLSKAKWRWMADKKVDSLNTLFDEKSMFVHMGGSWGKERELEVIKSGNIWYKKADVHEVSVQQIGNTAILLNRITLLAVVGGNEVTNPFMVTEVYVKEAGKWTMGSLSFSRLATQ